MNFFLYYDIYEIKLYLYKIKDLHIIYKLLSMYHIAVHC